MAGVQAYRLCAGLKLAEGFLQCKEKRNPARCGTLLRYQTDKTGG